MERQSELGCVARQGCRRTNARGSGGGDACRAPSRTRCAGGADPRPQRRGRHVEPDGRAGNRGLHAPTRARRSRDARSPHPVPAAWEDAVRDRQSDPGAGTARTERSRKMAAASGDESPYRAGGRAGVGPGHGDGMTTSGSARWLLVTEGGNGLSRAAVAVVRLAAAAGYLAAVTESHRFSLAGASRYCARRIPVPHASRDPQAYVAAVRRELSSRDYLGVIPCGEAALAALQIAPREFTDKVSWIVAARSAGLDVPPTTVF